MTIKELDEKLNSDGFQNTENDLFYNYYIYQYPADKEYDIRKQIVDFKIDLSRPTNYLDVLVIDLFKEFCAFLDKRANSSSAAATAIGTPTSAGDATPKPARITAPPRAADTALLTLKAIWMHAPPSISPPRANRTIIYCSGPPMPNSPAHAMKASASDVPFSGAQR